MASSNRPQPKLELQIDGKRLTITAQGWLAVGAAFILIASALAAFKGVF